MAVRRALSLLALACGVTGQALPPLPRLQLKQAATTVSGLSSGADFAVIFHIAFSDIVVGSGIFAGQAYMCAIKRFPGEAQYTCTEQPKGSQGPGCVGYKNAAPCDGCDAGLTIQYDHCKANESVIADVDVTLLAQRIVEAGEAGLIAPVSNLFNAAVYTYRGINDATYLPGTVNATTELFQLFVGDPSRVFFESNIPSIHAIPSIDPAVVADCDTGRGGGPPGLVNCSYDGAGAALRHMYGGTLTPPTARNSSAANILHFNQSLYLAGDGSLAPDAYVYIPPACAAGSGTTCRLHIAFHGCGQYAGSAAVGTSFVEHAGFNPWADANDLVILYPQGGGFPDSGQQAPSNQLAAGCWDGYGQTGIDFAYQSGPQVVAVRNMITALAGW